MFGAKCLERSDLHCINFFLVISGLRDNTAPAARNSVVMHLFGRFLSINRHFKGCIGLLSYYIPSLILVLCIWTFVVANTANIYSIYLMFIVLRVKNVAYSHDISVASTWLG